MAQETHAEACGLYQKSRLGRRAWALSVAIFLLTRDARQSNASSPKPPPQMSTQTSKDPLPELRGINSLAPELLLQIFMLVRPLLVSSWVPASIPIVRAENGRGRRVLSSPWSLTHVCRHWRSLATAYPALWASFVINESIPPSHLTLLYRQLKRSGTWPLDIILLFSKPWDVDSKSYIFLDRIRRETRRWKKLRLVVSCGEEVDHANDFLAQLTSLPILEELVVESKYYKLAPTEIFSQGCPRLHRVQTNTALVLPWSQLAVYKDPECGPALSGLRDASALHEADLAFDRFKQQNRDDATIELSQVRRLVAPYGNVLPFLATPRLEELCLVWLWDFENTLPFIIRSGCTLTSLQIIRCRADGPLIVDFLRHLPALTHLALDFRADMHFVHSAHNLRTMEFVIAALRVVADPEDPICPKLVSFSLSDVHDHLEPPERRDTLVEMVRSRTMNAVGVKDGRCAALKSVNVYGKRVRLAGAAYRMEKLGVRVENLTGKGAVLAVRRWRGWDDFTRLADY
ncbi:hypothetical protein HMN09_00563800 [Mycena chlorophos]|uniref:F-box domain-containing protein n=1 Tax=Mycena chlorophos TaxID=658473 RepID=A0A8H6TE05_MYCCL|nr:hypothetical protein HMN09_00563800 [Mycena chlorophos]